MANTSTTYQARAFSHPADFSKDVWRTLLLNEAAANVVLPFAKKALNFPRSNQKDQLWIALYDDAGHIVFILSCTRGPLGNYPIFIVASKSSTQVTQDDKRLADALLPLARRLLDEVPARRVFSVFSIARVTQAFTKIFETEARARGESGIRAIERPYYDATFTYCTAETLKQLSDTTSSLLRAEGVVISLCAADMSHLQGTKAMCKAFSSEPFILNDARAESEAIGLIENGQVWVHVVQKVGQESEVACIIATTRESDHVTAVTKVFTAEHWRGRGCAARLLHRVCNDLLQKKQRVVLYVGNTDDLAPARKVYHKIGFQGLDGSQVKDVERWLEIGFEGTDLGYW